MYSLLQIKKYSQIEKEMGNCKCRLDVIIQRTRSRTITKVVVGTTFSIFLHKINYLPGAIHVSKILVFVDVFHSFTSLAILCGIFCS